MMNICMCGYQPGAASHDKDCPYPLFRGTEQQERMWEHSRDANVRARHIDGYVREQARQQRELERSL